MTSLNGIDWIPRQTNNTNMLYPNKNIDTKNKFSLFLRTDNIINGILHNNIFTNKIESNQIKKIFTNTNITLKIQHNQQFC